MPGSKPYAERPLEDGSTTRSRPSRLPPGERCSKLRSNGEPCKGWAVRATEPPMCIQHGGRLPGNRNKAKARVDSLRSAQQLLEAAKIPLVRAQASLREASEEAVTVLRTVMADPEVPAYIKARTAADLLRLSGADLSRPATNVAVVLTGGEATAVDVLRARLEALSSAQPPDIIRGEVVG